LAGRAGRAVPGLARGGNAGLRIGIIGAGHIGGTLAERFVAAGHEVAISNSRRPETLAGLIEGAQPMTVEEAERFGEIVVVSIPLGRYRELPIEAVQGKVVIDRNNYYPQRDGEIAELDDDSTTSSELLQAPSGRAGGEGVQRDRLDEAARRGPSRRRSRPAGDSVLG
jgi:hypothetical protein